MNDIVKQIRNAIDEYIEETRKKNKARDEQKKLVADIQALKKDAEQLKVEARKITAADKAARDELLKPLCIALGLRLEDRFGNESVVTEYEDRDGTYTSTSTHHRGYICLVDRYGHTIYEDRIYDQYIGWGDKISKDKIAAAKREAKGKYDVLSLFADYMQSEKAIQELKETYLVPERWNLNQVETEIKQTVHDIGLDAVKETLKELKKQRAEIDKEVRAAKKHYREGRVSEYDYQQRSYNAAYDRAVKELVEVNNKIAVHERAVKLYGLKEDYIKTVAKVKSDVSVLGIIEVIDRVAPAQDKYLQAKAEADKTLESVKEINEQVHDMEYQREGLKSIIERMDQQVAEEVLVNGKIAEEVAKLVTEEFVKTSLCEVVRKDCYVQLSTGKSDPINQKITKEVFDKIEALTENETEREDA